jgi:ABC-type nitrate/sulfonate/bicarbonate transport system ATPase subunit
LSAVADRFESLAFEGVRHQFEGRSGVVPTLAGIDLEVGRKEFVTVVGPSGCGKSTLFNLASGLIRPTAGEIRVNGTRLSGVNPHVAYMFQQAALLDWRDVLGNVMVGQEFLGISKRDGREEALAALSRFGLAGFEHRHPWELSGGMRQRVALLRTYLTHRELLLLDEPFGALDALTRLQMQQFLLDQWQADQRTVVFITHDVDEALLLGDRVLVLAPRPSYVMASVEVGFDRPRNAEEVLADPSFVEVKGELLERLIADGDHLDHAGTSPNGTDSAAVSEPSGAADSRGDGRVA